VVSDEEIDLSRIFELDFFKVLDLSVISAILTLESYSKDIKEQKWLKISPNKSVT
jgi:hypothetical protein